MIIIWAMSDVHLALSRPDKDMGIRFSNWNDYVSRIKKNWIDLVGEDDIVLLPGDISWANKFNDALIDLKFLESLPGHKIISQGNHDFWWPSKTFISNLNLKNITLLKDDFVVIDKKVVIAAFKLTDVKEVLPGCIAHIFSEKKYKKELGIIDNTLSNIESNNYIRIVMVHYPPVSNQIQNTDINKLLQKHLVDICLFGHIHYKDCNEFINIEYDKPKYMLVSADVLDFTPAKILEI